MANKRSNQEIKSEKTKKMKKMRRDGDDEGGGGFNSLPDSMLHHILSFLNMKEAIRTSSVSKRWRYLWISTPSLNFTMEKDKDDYPRFIEFVDIVLLSHDGNIQRFSITEPTSSSYDDHHHSYSNFSSPPPGSPPPLLPPGSPHNHHYHDSDSDSDSDDGWSLGSRYSIITKKLKLRLEMWIFNAIRRNVEEIHLEMYFENISYRLLNSLFTCQSLKKLELISLDKVPMKCILPDSISLPSLQTLHLDRLLLRFEGDDKINKFLLNCCGGGYLESLILNDCGIHRRNLNIYALKLKHLVIKETYSRGLEHDEITGSVRLYTPNLISFDCEDYLLKNYYLENVSSLVEACIRMTVGSKAQKEARVKEKGRNAMIYGEKIDFKKLHNVKHLQLSSWAFQIFIATYELLDSGSTGFDNLRSLKLNAWLSRDCIFEITRLLNMSPNIVKLSLNIIEDTITPNFPRWDKVKHPDDIGDHWKLPLQCVLDHLKIVEIRGLVGRINELKFLEVLLKNAVVLENLALAFSFGFSSHYRSRDDREGLVDTMKNYSKILQLFPRASSSVTIVLI